LPPERNRNDSDTDSEQNSDDDSHDDDDGNDLLEEVVRIHNLIATYNELYSAGQENKLFKMNVVSTNNWFIPI